MAPSNGACPVGREPRAAPSPPATHALPLNRPTLRAITAAEKLREGMTTWCGIGKCRLLAEFVGTRGADKCFYCRKHAEAFAEVFAEVNGIVVPWHPPAGEKVQN